MALLSYVDYTVVSGVSVSGTGGWLPSLPLENLLTYDLGQPARATTKKVTISVDLATEKQVSLLAILKHSLTYSATARIRASNNITLLTEAILVPKTEVVYDSFNGTAAETSSPSSINVLSPPAYILVQDNLYFSAGDIVEVTSGTNYIIAEVVSYDYLTSELHLTVTNNSTGAYTGSAWTVTKVSAGRAIWPLSAGFGAQEWGQFVWDGHTDTVSSALNRPPALWVLDKDISARYYLIEIEDPDNPNGYIDLHKLLIGPAWRISTGIQLGYQIQYQDKSSTVHSRAGQEYTNKVPQYRRFSLDVACLPRKELYNNMLELDKLLGTGLPILVCIDPTDLANLGNKSIYGSQAYLRAAKEPQKDLMKKPIIIEEWV